MGGGRRGHTTGPVAAEPGGSDGSRGLSGLMPGRAVRCPRVGGDRDERGVEPRGAVVVEASRADVSQGGVGEGAVVVALGAVRGQGDADAEGVDRVLEPPEAVGADTLVEVRPEVLRPEGERRSKAAPARARSPEASRDRPTAQCSQAVRGGNRDAPRAAASATSVNPRASACACRSRKRR